MKRVRLSSGKFLVSGLQIQVNATAIPANSLTSVRKVQMLDSLFSFYVESNSSSLDARGRDFLLKKYISNANRDNLKVKEACE
jgi:hypothetical protein